MSSGRGSRLEDRRPPLPLSVVLPASADARTRRALTRRVRRLAARGTDRTLVCDASRLSSADLATLERLARLALMARRAGCAMRLANAAPELGDLVRLAGLAAVLGCPDASGVDPGREPEEREEPRRVEEERDPGDPVA